MPPRYAPPVFAAVALLLLTGTRCVFIATSGDRPPCRSTTDKHCDSKVTVSVGETIARGRLIDAPVEGVAYVSGSIAGVTAADGSFEYESGGRVRFFIGDIALGEPAAGKAHLSPLDLVRGGTLDTPAVINIARLLQSLDAVPGDDGITITAGVRAEATRSNAAVGASIVSLDFADDTAFVNAAAQLVSTLTADFPRTAVLVDAPTARAALVQGLENAGIR